MDVISGEIKIEKGFLEDVEKKVMHSDSGKWISDTYVSSLEEQLGIMITIARDALKLSSISREELKKLKESLK